MPLHLRFVVNGNQLNKLDLLTDDSLFKLGTHYRTKGQVELSFFGINFWIWYATINKDNLWIKNYLFYYQFAH